MDTVQGKLLEYKLIDSGLGEKLERFGSVQLARPSSLAIWKRRHAELWNERGARFMPDERWQNAPQEAWEMTIEGLRCLLRCQSNGQVGVFPEHVSYFEWLSNRLASITKLRAPRVLNLFAYTGLATVHCALAGAHVTHVDISKPVLTWARENMELNSVHSEKVRFICDDAIVFAERECRRGNFYDLIIADPPTFSRTAKGKSWEFDSVITSFLTTLTQLCNPQGSAFVLSSHHHALTASVLRNIVLDMGKFSVETKQLELMEHRSERTIPAGTALFASTDTLLNGV